MNVNECHWCGDPVGELTGSQSSYYRKTGRWYCSQLCSKAYRAEVSSQTMAATNRKYASARMKARNPMRLPEARAAMANTLKQMKHCPALRGGNGKPATAAEKALYFMLSPLGFKLQTVVKTHAFRGPEGYPSCYKLDIGHIGLKLGVEADGYSHCSLARKAQDAKKERCLKDLGWTVLRFTNERILTAPAEVGWEIMCTISKLRGCTPTSPTE